MTTEKMTKQEYLEARERFAKFMDTDKSTSKWNIHQKANFLWYMVAMVIEGHYQKRQMDKISPLLYLIVRQLKKWGVI